MKRMNSSQIIMPNTAEPPTAAPLIRKPDECSVSTMRTRTASSTGAPSSRPRNTERRDHRIWPGERWKRGTADAQTEGEVRGALPDTRGAGCEAPDAPGAGCGVPDGPGARCG